MKKLSFIFGQQNISIILKENKNIFFFNSYPQIKLSYEISRIHIQFF